MPSRPYWSGHIRLSLVSLEVELYAAYESKQTVSFHMLHKPTGERVHYQKITENAGVVKNEDIVKGYEYEKGQYIMIEPEELDQLKIESREVVDIVQFIDKEAIDPIFINHSYFIVPHGDIAEEAYIILRDALEATGKAGLGQIVLDGREHIAAIRPYEYGMIMETLHYESEVRELSRYMKKKPKAAVNDDGLAMAKELISRKSGKFDISAFHDHYHEALDQLVKDKLAHHQPKEIAKPKNMPKVVNLMDALKRSLAAA